MTMGSKTLLVITNAASIGEKAVLASPQRRKTRIPRGWIVSAIEVMKRMRGHRPWSQAAKPMQRFYRISRILGLEPNKALGLQTFGGGL